MTDEQINATIAEACGWTLVKDDPDFHEYWEHPTDGRKIGVAVNPSPFPDYCNDLNAMHEAEEFLKYDSESTWLTNGYSLYVQALPYDNEIRATARERAEAFLRTIGKWEEVQP